MIQMYYNVFIIPGNYESYKAKLRHTLIYMANGLSCFPFIMFGIKNNIIYLVRNMIFVYIQGMKLFYDNWILFGCKNTTF